METVLIVIHLIVVLALVGVVLLQRSEGGGLGIGGGSGFMTARGAANALTRTTAILATAFFLTSLALSILARYGERPTDILDRVPAQGEQQQNGTILDQLGGQVTKPAAETPAAQTETAPAVPTENAPAAQVPAEPAAPAAPEAPAAPAVPTGQ
ncbi:MAG: preprotein translocase subunit SecG [Notoacmeibacter sp.]|nr:preprotein translocase subunit SecG [Notoacmeibacter sp.]